MAKKDSILKDYQPGFLDETIDTKAKKNNSVRVNSYDTYVSRNISEDTLNWNTVAKTITGQLNAVAKDRIDRRQNIEDKTNEAITQLENLDNYTEVNQNNAVIDVAQGIKENLLIANRLLKQGVLKPVDYLKLVEGAKAQMKQWSNSSKTFEEDFTTQRDRVNDNLAGADEIFLSQSYYMFGNMKNVKGYVSPGNKAYLVRVDGETGEFPDLEKNPGRFLPVQSMNGRNSFQSNRAQFDVREQVALRTEKMGEFINVYVKDSVTFENGVLTVTEEGLEALNNNPDLKAQFDAYKKTVVDSITESPNGQSLANVLVQSEGSGYKYATSKAAYLEQHGADADLNKMIIINPLNLPPTYTFGEKNSQKDVAQEAAKDIIEREVDFQTGSTRKEDLSDQPSTDDQLNPPSSTEKKDALNKSSLVTFINDIQSGVDGSQSKFDQDENQLEVESIQMVDKNGEVTEDKSEAISMRVVKIQGNQEVTTNIELRKEIDGSRIDKRKTIKDKDGKNIPNPNLGKPNAQLSNELILEGYLGNLGVENSEIDDYMKAYKASGGKIGDFVGKNYKRESVRIVDTSAQPIDRKNGKEGTTGLIITEVLENKEDESPFQALFIAANVKDAPDKAKKDFNRYKVNMISSYINDAFGISLRGKPFNLRLNDNGTITVRFNNSDITLPKTLSGYNTSGQEMISDIENILNLDRLPLGTCVNGRKSMGLGVFDDC